ncbi:MAG: hypothetical protein GQ570_01930 [Helicobacteraceae bacterium]|nr:hypothetical protein [Helicobacteraceae bacterium]
MTALLTLLPIFGYATLFNIYFNKKPSVSIFFAITFIITLLFFLGLAEQLKYGAYLLFYGGIVALVYTLFKQTKLFKEWLLSVPVVMFTIMSTLYLYLFQDAQLFWWDEFSHWGAFIKEMFFFNSFYDATSVATHLRYPPGTATWEYFVIANTFFSEGNLYFACFLLLFSSTLMMYERVTFKDMHWIILIFIIQIVLFSGFGHWFSSIYVDHIIGAMFAGLVLSYLVDEFKANDLWLFIFPLATIVLVKEIGLYFGLSFIGFVFLYSIVELKKVSKKITIILFLLFLSMVLVLKVWGIRQDSLDVKKGGQTMSAIAKSMFSDHRVLEPKVEEEVKRRFWDVVQNQQIHKEKFSLNYNEFSYDLMSHYKKENKLSTLGTMLFFMFMFIVAFLMSNSKEQRVKVSIIYAYILFVTTVYLFILYFSFQVAFGQGALRIPSFVRYMNMAILPMLLIGFSIFLPLYNEKLKQTFNQEFNSKLFAAALMLVIVLGYVVNPYFKPLYSQLKNPSHENFENIATQILEKVPPKSKVFVVFPIQNNGSLNIMLKYSLIPAKATISKADFESKTFDQMLSIYSKYEYVWFTKFNNKLIDKNRPILKAKSDNQPFVLYKTDVLNNGIKFIPVL